jgi:hypothetical protein
MSCERSTSLISSSGAERAGLAAPHTVIASDDELEKIDGPIVVKSRLHWPPGSSQPGLRLPTKVVFTKDDVPNGSPTSARWAASHSYKRSFEDASCTATSSWSEMDG